MVNRIQIELYLVVRIKRMANRVAIVWMTMATMSKILISILNIPLNSNSSAPTHRPEPLPVFTNTNIRKDGSN